jgi:hypothetical protein
MLQTISGGNHPPRLTIVHVYGSVAAFLPGRLPNIDAMSLEGNAQITQNAPPRPLCGTIRPPSTRCAAALPCVVPMFLTVLPRLLDLSDRRCRHRTVSNRSPFKRPSGWMRLGRTLVYGSAVTVLGLAAANAQADWLESGDQLRILYGPSAYHFSQSDAHVRYNHLLAGELLSKRWIFWGADRSIIGFAALDNSFGQFSQYAYFGQEWDLKPVAGGVVFANVTAGLLHGYKDPYADKIPFNQFGIAPAIVPTIGWRYNRFSASVSLLGTNGFLAAVGWTFDLRK